MEKFRVEVFDLELRESRSNGTARIYRLPKERIRALGQASVLVLEVRILVGDPGGAVAVRRGCDRLQRVT